MLFFLKSTIFSHSFQIAYINIFTTLKYNFQKGPHFKAVYSATSIFWPGQSSLGYPDIQFRCQQTPFGGKSHKKCRRQEMSRVKLGSSVTGCFSRVLCYLQQINKQGTLFTSEHFQGDQVYPGIIQQFHTFHFNCYRMSDPRARLFSKETVNQPLKNTFSQLSLLCWNSMPCFYQSQGVQNRGQGTKCSHCILTHPLEFRYAAQVICCTNLSRWHKWKLIAQTSTHYSCRKKNITQGW